MSDKIKPIWRYPYNKLSDILVPLSIVEKQIRAIEGLDNFHFEIHLKSVDAKRKNLTKDNIYAIPYPFIKGVKDEYEENGMGLYDYDDEMKYEINNRLMKYYNFIIDRETINEVDNNPNLCSILNICNGLISTFDRTEVQEIIPLTIPYELPTMVSKLWGIHDASESDDYDAMLNGIIPIIGEDDDFDKEDMLNDYLNSMRQMVINYALDGENYMIVYQLVRSKNVPDKRLYNGKAKDDCIWASGTSDLLHTKKECMIINNNTLHLYKQKSKVILVK